MRKVVPLVFISGVAFAIASCSLFVDLDGLDDGGASDAGDEFCVCEDAGNGDAKVGDAADASTPLDAGINPCLDGGGTAGPRMIQADGYCIDSTEVTVGQYSDFLADGGNGVTNTGVCGWNLGFSPDVMGVGDPRCTAPNVDPTFRAQYPMTCINWCDAFAYCEWAGKRLCGAINGGGSVPFGSFSTNSQWYLACSTTAADTYPNDSDDGGKCWLGHKSAGSVPVDSLGCNGGYPGLTDMVGNVEEWSDSCDTTGETDGGGPRRDYCHDEGDEFDENFSGQGCTANDQDRREETWSGIGFRCCSK
ncbi:MAG: SUMF1/EgtB/PvdO family nonheme iron enzyme [Polyangiaceae bacterium]